DRQRVAGQAAVAAGQAGFAADAEPGARCWPIQAQAQRLAEHRREVEIGRRRQYRGLETERLADRLAAGKAFDDRFGCDLAENLWSVAVPRLDQADGALAGREPG